MYTYKIYTWIHTHTHSLLLRHLPSARPKNVSKAFFPKDYQVSATVPLNQSSFIYTPSSCLHLIPGWNYPGLPHPKYKKNSGFFTQYWHPSLIIFAPQPLLKNMSVNTFKCKPSKTSKNRNRCRQGKGVSGAVRTELGRTQEGCSVVKFNRWSTRIGQNTPYASNCPSFLQPQGSTR